jgi:hypothetical protein
MDSFVFCRRSYASLRNPMGRFVDWGSLPGMLRNGLRSGVRIPGVKEGTYGQANESTEVALAKYRKSIDRLGRGDACLHDSPAFGPMSLEDRIRLNLRHAELHLSFLDYGGSDPAVSSADRVDQNVAARHPYAR